MLIYIAGPYRGNVDENISKARLIAIEVWESGNTALCPHLNTYHFEQDCNVDDEVYLTRDLDILSRCDAILMIPSWKDSTGAKRELSFALDNNIPVYYYPELPPLNQTEQLRPKQCEAFRLITGAMYRLHLAKNHDYSPANILATGEIGLVTRLWDKIARLMNLIGFRFEIYGQSFEKPSEPKNESINDTLIDAANYAVIGQILRQGNWGK